MNPLNLKKTNTTRFMLAMLFNDDVNIHNILKDDFIDSYTSDYYEPENDGYLMIVKSTNQEPRGTIINPIKSYQRDTNYVFVYEIPDEYKKDYELLRKGSLNLTSIDYKSKLIKFWNEIPTEYDIDFYTKLCSDPIQTKIYKYNPFQEMYRVRKDD